MIFILGIDAATWTVIKPNLNRLPTFKKLGEIGKCREIVVREKLLSASIWCGMFCGKTPEEHGHEAYVTNGHIVKREDIKVDFIWDIMGRAGRKVKVLNVPFIVPPYSFNADFRPVGFGLPTNEKEWHEELEMVTAKANEAIVEKPELLIACYTLLDRIQHFHWGEDCVLEWYVRLDAKMNELLFGSGFIADKNNRLIIISDHGFCSFGEAELQTLPAKSEWGELKGDHHEKALLITVNMDYPINKPQDVFYAIKQDLG